MFNQKNLLLNGIIAAILLIIGVGTIMAVKADNPPDLTSCNGNFQTYYRDADEDNYGNPALPLEACTQPDGYAVTATDCNDANSQIYPGAAEICNGLDNNCNGTIDEGCATITYYRDVDVDGYGDLASSTQSTFQPAGYVAVSTDCNDNNAQIHPGASEICNGVDDNCNSQIDEGVIFTYYRDFDTDTYGGTATSTQACSKPDGYVTNHNDCNDFNSAINPGVVEICNNIDDNCNGTVDEGCNYITYYRDYDSDGYGNSASSTQATTQPAGYVTNNTDCNDSNVQVHPGAAEICNSLDDNCNGTIDEGCNYNTYYRDYDSDGYGNSASSTQAFTQPAGYVTNSTDCNDNNAQIHPGASEICNGIDDNCNGQIDEGVITTYYRDLDDDSYGGNTTSTQACSKPDGYVSNNTDCNDSNTQIHPGATEACNGVDDDCDGVIDEGCNQQPCQTCTTCCVTCTIKCSCQTQVIINNNNDNEVNENNNHGCNVSIASNSVGASVSCINRITNTVKKIVKTEIKEKIKVAKNNKHKD